MLTLPLSVLISPVIFRPGSALGFRREAEAGAEPAGRHEGPRRQEAPPLTPAAAARPHCSLTTATYSEVRVAQRQSQSGLPGRADD